MTNNCGVHFIVLQAILLSVIRAEYRLVFEDNFDTLNFNNWEHEITAWGGGNSEFQVYTNDPINSFVENGTLHLKPTMTKDNINPLTGQPFGEEYLFNGVMNLTEMYGKCTNSDNYGCFREGKYGILPSVMSARIRTAGKFSFKYGILEVEARMPVGDWLWPAIWLLPEDWEYGAWPRSGEIDLIESRGNRDLKSSSGDYLGIQSMGATLHWGPQWDINRYYLTHASRENTERNFGDYFHTYRLEWSEDGFRFLVDGIHLADMPDPLIPNNADWQGFWKFGSDWPEGFANPWNGGSSMAPFDKKFHIIMNVAVGGTNSFFPDDAVNKGGAAPKPWQNGGGKPDIDFWNGSANWFPTWEGANAAMQVKSVKVYQKNEPTESGVGHEAPWCLNLILIFTTTIMLNINLNT